MAPEYTQTGLITEKADVYAFGIVLLEILTGIKAIEFSKTSRQQYFPDLVRIFLNVIKMTFTSTYLLIELDTCCTLQGRRLLVEGKVCARMIDPKLEDKYDVKEVEYMIHAANLCILPHPEQRPRMSKVYPSFIKYLYMHTCLVGVSKVII